MLSAARVPSVLTGQARMASSSGSGLAVVARRDDLAEPRPIGTLLSRANGTEAPMEFEELADQDGSVSFMEYLCAEPLIDGELEIGRLDVGRAEVSDPLNDLES
jgi:hypothetical protein